MRQSCTVAFNNPLVVDIEEIGVYKSLYETCDERQFLETFIVLH